MAYVKMLKLIHWEAYNIEGDRESGIGKTTIIKEMWKSLRVQMMVICFGMRQGRWCRRNSRINYN